MASFKPFAARVSVVLWGEDDEDEDENHFGISGNEGNSGIIWGNLGGVGNVGNDGSDGMEMRHVGMLLNKVKFVKYARIGWADNTGNDDGTIVGKIVEPESDVRSAGKKGFFCCC